MQRNSFVFYKDWMEAIRDLSDDIRLEIYESVIEYATSGELMELKPMANIAFNFIKTYIDRDAKKYISMIDRNKNNGCKGGRPKEPKEPTGLSDNPKEPKEPDNDNDNVKLLLFLDGEDSVLDEDHVNFKKFQKWIKATAPNVGKMKEPFTLDEFKKIKAEFEYNFITTLLLEMHNWKDLLKKNVSANLTFRKWANKRK